MDDETRAAIETVRKEVVRDRRRLDAQSLELMFLFQPDSHPARQRTWQDLTGYGGGTAGWFEAGVWCCGITVPNEDDTDIVYCDVFFNWNHQKACEKFGEHACEIAALLKDAGYSTQELMFNEGVLVKALFQLNRASATLSWEENQQPGHPETKSRIARLTDIFSETEMFLAAVLEASNQRKQRRANRAENEKDGQTSHTKKPRRERIGFSVGSGGRIRIQKSTSQWTNSAKIKPN